MIIFTVGHVPHEQGMLINGGPILSSAASSKFQFVAAPPPLPALRPLSPLPAAAIAAPSHLQAAGHCVRVAGSRLDGRVPPPSAPPAPTAAAWWPGAPPPPLPPARRSASGGRLPLAPLWWGWSVYPWCGGAVRRRVGKRRRHAPRAAWGGGTARRTAGSARRLAWAPRRQASPAPCRACCRTGGRRYVAARRGCIPPATTRRFGGVRCWCAAVPAAAHGRPGSVAAAVAAGAAVKADTGAAGATSGCPARHRCGSSCGYPAASATGGALCRPVPRGW